MKRFIIKDLRTEKIVAITSDVFEMADIMDSNMYYTVSYEEL